MEGYEARILKGLLDSYERRSFVPGGKIRWLSTLPFPLIGRICRNTLNESSLAYEEIHSCMKSLEDQGPGNYCLEKWKRGSHYRESPAE